MSTARGFTLLEVMVVLAIIGALLSMVTLSGGDRQAEDQVTRTGEQIRALFMAYQQEASFQNIDLGVAMDSGFLKLLSLQDLRKQEVQAGKDREEIDAIQKNPWQAYQGSLKGELGLPETTFMTLSVEGKEADLDAEVGKEGPKPVLLFLSSDEYTPFELLLNHSEDTHFAVKLSGDGFNPPVLEVEHFED